MTKLTAALMLFPVLMFLGCENVDLPTPPGAAQAQLVNPEGEKAGTATLTETDNGVDVELQISNLEPGNHGLHIHEVGSCQTPDFESAGGHMNPTGAQHGFEAPAGPHMGDLCNLPVNECGEAETNRTIDNATLGSGERSLLGKASVIHAEPDDYESQPAGDAGARVACGVIEMRTPALTWYPAGS